MVRQHCMVESRLLTWIWLSKSRFGAEKSARFCCPTAAAHSSIALHCSTTASWPTRMALTE